MTPVTEVAYSEGKQMKRSTLQLYLGVISLTIISSAAKASTPAEKIECTQAARSEWMPEAKIKEIFGDKSYALVKLKVSRGNCYEFYAIHGDGSVVEAYYNPVSGEVVRYNKVLQKGAEPTLETRTAGTDRPLIQTSAPSANFLLKQQ
jgi:hypothetical protein